MAADYSRVVVDACLPYFERDERYFLLVGDMGFGAIDGLEAAFPERVLNCGIMEQGMTGIAAGMSLGGLVPIVYTVVNFLAFRALEQVRNDVVLQNLNVKFLGTGANDRFRFLGASHSCGQDDVAIMKLIGLPVYDPYDTNRSFDDLLGTWLTEERAGYFRV